MIHRWQNADCTQTRCAGSTWRVLALLLLLTTLIAPARVVAQPAPPDPRFGVVEAVVNPEAATELGAGYTRIILRWDVIQPGGPADWKPANVPDPMVAGELAAGREVVAVLIGTPAWAAAGGEGGDRAQRAGYVLLGSLRAPDGPALSRAHPPLDYLERAGCVGAESPGQHLGGIGRRLL